MTETIQTLPVVIEVHRFIKTNPWAPDSDSRKVIEKEVGIYRLNLNENLYYWQGWQ